MAKKSNKTAHVLNLLAGHDNTKEAVEEAAAEETSSVKKMEADEELISPPASSTDTGTRPAATVTSAPAAPQNISVIDTTGEDPVAALIHEKLSAELEPQTDEVPLSEGEVTVQPEAEGPAESVETEVLTVPTSPSNTDLSSETSSISNVDIQPTIENPPHTESQTVANIPMEAEAQPETETLQKEDRQPETEVPLETETLPEASNFPLDAEPPSASKPEPDFTSVNVMERIVKDKIIYFMRQFDVCTCDRCVADTIAMTLNGLTPKYIVTTPAAVDPLLSYYTNRLIPDVTVEATKACIIIKDHPRH
ncbi:MAG: hypothetical protein HFH24_03900 [Ruminococcus sp.]|nr:hypothetical protein [Ruminococcus sp.]